MKWFIWSSVAVIAALLLGDIWWLDPNDFRVAANTCLAAAALLTTIFTVRYAFWSKWWTSRIGPTYLAFKVLMSALLDQITVSTWWDTDFPGRQELRFAIYAVVVLAAVSMIVKLSREQNRS